MGSFRLTGVSARLRSVAAGPLSPQGQGVVVLALGLEIGLFVWLAATFRMPSLVALAPPVVVTAVLALAFRTVKDKSRRPWPVAAALGVALTLDAALAAFLVLVLFLVLAEGALAGKGLLAVLLLPAILGAAVYANVGLPIFLALVLVLILALGALMDAGPVALLAVPLVLSLAVAVALFNAISPDHGRLPRRFP